MSNITDDAWLDIENGTSTILNETNIPTNEIVGAFQAQHPELASLVRWTSNVQNSGNRHGSLIQRDTYLSPESLFDQFRTAQYAAEYDDVVSGILESTEALAFNKISISCDDEEQENIWNQLIEDIDLDRLLREMWREIFTISQFYCGIVWGYKDYKVEGKTKNRNKARKSFGALNVPLGITLLDPLKVVPVGSGLFGMRDLAYIATQTESLSFDDVLAGKNTSDQAVDQLIDGKIELYPEDPRQRRQMQMLQEVTGMRNPHEFLYALNSKNVFRHTATKADYQRYASVRMKSIFELLDLKRQLIQMDRVFLLGSVNFILLVKKGSDAMPAKAGEMTDLAGQIKTSARLPVIISDHRIEIEIITPKTDQTLKGERYDTIDLRIRARLYQMLSSTSSGSGTKSDDSIKLARVIARGLESRRMMIAKSLHKNLLKPIFERNDQLTEPATLVFQPKRISLDFDVNLSNFIQASRDRGDISRDTVLSELDIDQDAEATKRMREKESGYDDIFAPTTVPFSTPINKEGEDEKMPMDPKAAGRMGGGNKNGGGMNPKSGESNPGKGTVPEKPKKNEKTS